MFRFFVLLLLSFFMLSANAQNFSLFSTTATKQSSPTSSVGAPVSSQDFQKQVTDFTTQNATQYQQELNASLAQIEAAAKANAAASPDTSSPATSQSPQPAAVAPPANATQPATTTSPARVYTAPTAASPPTSSYTPPPTQQQAPYTGFTPAPQTPATQPPANNGWNIKY